MSVPSARLNAELAEAIERVQDLAVPDADQRAVNDARVVVPQPFQVTLGLGSRLARPECRRGVRDEVRGPRKPISSSSSRGRLPYQARRNATSRDPCAA